MQIRKYKHIVLGAGISGLSLALELQDKGEDVLVLEKNKFPGGVLQSVKNGSFEWDRAAHTIAVDSQTKRFFEKYHVDNLLVKPESLAKVRQVAVKGRLYEVENHPLKILSAKFLSLRAKFQLIKELFKKPIKIENPTVYEFFTYHFGQEITQNIISAVFAGIYAGDIEQMEMKSVMAKVFEIEQKSGSLIRGLMKNKGQFQSREIYGIKGGMAEFGKHLSMQIGNIEYDKEVLGIKKNGGEYHVDTKDGSYVCDSLISTLPAYAISGLLPKECQKLSDLLAQIKYEPMILLHVGFQNVNEEIDTKAFGFLCSQFDSPVLKGALYNSDLFNARAEKKAKAITIFMKPQLDWLNDEDKLSVEILKTIEEFKELLNIKEDPFILERSVWAQAIPQFNRPYSSLKSEIETAAALLPGFTLSGSFMSGVSVPDCIKYNSKLADLLS